MPRNRKRDVYYDYDEGRITEDEAIDILNGWDKEYGREYEGGGDDED